MKYTVISLLLSSLLAASHAAAAPAPPTPTGPGPEATRQIEARRKALSAFEFVDLERLSDTQRAETLKAMEPALKDLGTALASRDQYIFSEAVRDLVNGNYRGFPRDRILELLLPRLKTPETNIERMRSQSFIMEHLAAPLRRPGQGGSPRSPGDDYQRQGSYLPAGAGHRGGRAIAPGDEAVIKALIEAIDNPNPRNESGVHDRAAAWRWGDGARRGGGQTGPAETPGAQPLVRGRGIRGPGEDRPRREAQVAG